MNSNLTFGQFFWRIVLVIVAVAVTFLLWQVADVLLLLFAGLLLGVFLGTLTQLLQRLLPLSKRVAFWAILVLLVLSITLLGWFLAPRLTQELNALFTQIPEAFDEFRTQLTHYGWTQELLDQMSSVTQAMPAGSTLFTRVTGTFSSLLHVLTNLIFILFVGIFLAADPAIYRRGLLKLVPASRRTRMEQVIGEVVTTLRWWLLGKLFSMIVIGSLTGVALWLLGLPFALALGIIAGLLEFIPFVGPVVTGMLAGLLAFVQSPQQALYVLLLYIGIQQFESNILTPLVHRYTVSLAPVLSLTAVLIMGALFGFIGILVATPVLAVIVVLVKLLYVEEVLGEVPELPRQLLRSEEDGT